MRLVHAACLLAGLMVQRHSVAAETPMLEREILIEGRYLHIPVKADAPRRTLSIVVDGEVVRAFEVELAEGPADMWAFTDVSDWLGKKVKVRLDPIGRIGPVEAQKISAEHPPSAHVLTRLRLGNELINPRELYHEPLRPQFHFTTRRGWLNDPNGPIFFQGEYHLFYQLQPFSMKSLNSDKSWGHAVSRDLLHWEELPVSLHPDRAGGIWSGSTLVDTHNTLGVQRGDEPTLVAFYTATGRSAMNPKPAEENDFVQAMAYSHDRGRTWTKYAGNPILGNITPLNRDPYVFWHAPSKRWVMVLYVGSPRSNPGNHYMARILTSENLKDWTSESIIDGYFDCPILFELPLDGNPADTRWVVHCANMKYQVGRFDGKKFTAETTQIDSHVGKIGESAYSAQIFRNLPDSRTVQIAWLYNQAPGARQIMTFPCELKLITTPEGPRLRWRPVEEIDNLHGTASTLRDQAIVSGAQPQTLAHGRHLDIRIDLRAKPTSEVELMVRGISFVLHSATRVLSVRGYDLPVDMKEGSLSLRILVDETSLEIFADDGRVYLPLTVVMNPENEAVTICARGGPSAIEAMKISELKSIWPD